MNVVTIPRALRKEKNLIAVPRNTYEEFLAWQKKNKSMKTFIPTASEKRSLARARKNFLRGNYVTLEKIQNELEGHS